MAAWSEKANEVHCWAARWLDKGEALGCTGVPTDDSFDIYIGGDRLLRVPLDRHLEVSAAVAAITGDRVSHFVYLRLLNHVGYTHLGARDAAGRLVGMPGFLVQVISAGNVPL